MEKVKIESFQDHTKWKTPMETVHAYCHYCSQSRFDEAVNSCEGDKAASGSCPLYPYRNGNKRIKVKVFRSFCLQCQGLEMKDAMGIIADCPALDCLIHQYRMGKNPSRAGMGGKNLPSLKGVEPSFGIQESIKPSPLTKDTQEG